MAELLKRPMPVIISAIGLWLLGLVCLAAMPFARDYEMHFGGLYFLAGIVALASAVSLTIWHRWTRPVLLILAGVAAWVLLSKGSRLTHTLVAFPLLSAAWLSPLYALVVAFLPPTNRWVAGTRRAREISQAEDAKMANRAADKWRTPG